MSYEDELIAREPAGRGACRAWSWVKPANSRIIRAQCLCGCLLHGTTAVTGADCEQANRAHITHLWMVEFGPLGEKGLFDEVCENIT